MIRPNSRAEEIVGFGPGFAQSIAADGDVVWTTHFTDRSSWSGSATPRPHPAIRPNIPTADVAAGDGGVWFLGWEPDDQAHSPRNDPGRLGRVDPRTLAVTDTTELKIGELDETLALGG